MGSKDVICARWGCGHTKRQHDDPAFEGMCAAPGCNCLGFTRKRLPDGRTVAPTAAKAHTPPFQPSRAYEVGEKVQFPDGSEQVVAGTAVAEPPTPAPAPEPPAPEPPAPTPAPVATPAARTAGCVSTCPGCGKTCSGGDADHDGPHFRRGRPGDCEHAFKHGHRWEQTPVETDEQPVEVPITVVEEPTEVLEVDEPEQVTGISTPVTREVVPLAFAPDPEPDLELPTGVDEPVDEAEVGPQGVPGSAPGPIGVPGPVDPRYALAYEKHPDGKRHCPQCDQDKPVEDFSPGKGQFDGLHGWCRPCERERDKKRPMTLGKALRNRARHRATAELVQLHGEEFDELFAKYLTLAEEEARVLAEADSAKEAYGDSGEHVRLQPGRRQQGQDAVDRIDVARCPDCIRYHDTGHVCGVCGSKPEHLHVTQTAWAGTQEKLRERLARDAEAVSE